MTQSTRTNIITDYINREVPLKIAVRKLNLTEKEQKEYSIDLKFLLEERKRNPKIAYWPVESD